MRELITLFLLCLLCVFAALYFRSGYPAQWNECLAILKAPESSKVSNTSPNSQSAPVTSSSPITPVAVLAALMPSASTQSQSVPPPVAVPKYVPPAIFPAQDHWTWNVKNREYHEVVINKADADSVSISYAGGIGRVEMADLDPDLQRQLNYNPEAAAVSVAQKQAAAAKSDALAAQQRQAAIKKKVEAEKAQAAEQQQQQPSAIANENQAAINAGRVEQAKQMRANYVQNMDIAKKHLTVTPDGALIGDSFYLSKYNDAMNAISQCDTIIDSGGKQ